MFCTDCRQELAPGHKFCPACGATAVPPSPVSQPAVSAAHEQTTVRPTPTQGLASAYKVTFVIVVVAIIVAAIALHSYAAMLASAASIYLAFAVFKPALRVGKSLGVITLALCVAVAITEGMEQRAESAAKRQTEEAAKQEQLRTQQEAKKREDAFNALSSQGHLKNARDLLKVSSSQDAISEGLKHLAAIPTGTPEAQLAASIRASYESDRLKLQQAEAKAKADAEKKQIAAQLAANRILRDALAQSIENEMLNEGFNVDVNAIGPDHTTLRLKYIFVSKVFAHQLSQKPEFFERLRDVGFQKLICTDGYDESWSWKI